MPSKAPPQNASEGVTMDVDAFQAAMDRPHHVRALKHLLDALQDAEWEADAASQTAPDDRKRTFLKGMSNRLHELRLQLSFEGVDRG